MKFSIITPSFNQGQYISQTIESIVNQQGDFEIEYIVMDGGSTDNTLDILKKYEKCLKANQRVTFIWRSKKDKGQSDAINQGLKLATGDILAYINSDDYYEPGIFQKITRAFNKNTRSKWLTGYSHIVNEQGTIIQQLISQYKNFWLNLYSYQTLLILNYISQPSTFWKKELRDITGDFNESLHLTMDYDYWLRIGKNNNPIILKEYVSNFRIHSGSKGKKTFIKQFNEDLETAKKYTQNPLIIHSHTLHNLLIKTSYLWIKR